MRNKKGPQTIACKVVNEYSSLFASSEMYVYKDANGKSVKLKTINTSIKPDVKNGAWKQFKDEFYTCDTGYMSCPITNLPV